MLRLSVFLLSSTSVTANLALMPVKSDSGLNSFSVKRSRSIENLCPNLKASAVPPTKKNLLVLAWSLTLSIIPECFY